MTAYATLSPLVTLVTLTPIFSTVPAASTPIVKGNPDPTALRGKAPFLTKTSR